MDFERGPLTWLAFHLDPPAMVSDYTFTYGKTQPQSCFPPRGEKGMKNLRHILGLDAKTRIRHRNRVEFHQHLFQLLRIAINLGQVLVLFT